MQRHNKKQNTQHLNQRPTERKHKHFHQATNKKQVTPPPINQPRNERDYTKGERNDRGHAEGAEMTGIALIVEIQESVPRNERGGAEEQEAHREHKEW